MIGDGRRGQPLMRLMFQVPTDIAGPGGVISEGCLDAKSHVLLDYCFSVSPSAWPMCVALARRCISGQEVNVGIYK